MFLSRLSTTILNTVICEKNILTFRPLMTLTLSQGHSKSNRLVAD